MTDEWRRHGRPVRWWAGTPASAGRPVHVDNFDGLLAQSEQCNTHSTQNLRRMPGSGCDSRSAFTTRCSSSVSWIRNQAMHRIPAASGNIDDHPGRHEGGSTTNQIIEKVSFMTTRGIS